MELPLWLVHQPYAAAQTYSLAFDRLCVREQDIHVSTARTRADVASWDG